METVGVLGFILIAIIAYNREEKIQRFLSGHRALNRVYPYGICFVIAFLFALKLKLSPLSLNRPGTDSSVFLYIGQAMYRGAVPYKDLFDHKGVILYGLEWLGFLIGKGREFGVWIIELVHIFVTAMLFYHTARLFSQSKILCFLSVFVVLHLCSLSFIIGEGGNLTEEYALPWIASALYFVVKYFCTGQYKNWNIVLMGIGFAMVLFLRVNMAGVWLPLLLAVVISFLKEKHFSEIFKCAGLFLLGCLIVLIPLLIYFLLTDSLQSMIDYYINFNLRYTGSHSKKGMIVFAFDCVTYAGVAGFFILYSLVIGWKNRMLWFNAGVMFCAYIFAAISGRAYAHYGIILIPFFVIPTIVSLSQFMEKMKEISPKLHTKSALTGIVILSFLCIAVQPVYSVYALHKESTPSQDEIPIYLSSQTDESDDVLLLGNYVNGYREAHRWTKNKFFYQFPPIEVSDALYEEFMDELQQKPSDYIIVMPNTSYFEGEKYQQVLAYLNEQCVQGAYQLEDHGSFQVYIRK